ncbi:hypothetical protein N9164_00075 [Draconibacterium sp.]|nr:hypothetical protein [Draconibacterium sp.]
MNLLTTFIFVLFTVMAFGKQINSMEEIPRDTLTLEEPGLLVTNSEVSSVENEKVIVDGKNKSNINTSKQLPADRGYLVTVNSSNEKFKHVVTADQDRVVKLFEAYFGTDLDIMKILDYSPYFDMKTDDVYFYAEKGSVREGKDGQLKFKRLKKSRK